MAKLGHGAGEVKAVPGAPIAGTAHVRGASRGCAVRDGESYPPVVHRGLRKARLLLVALRHVAALGTGVA
jgi:hypothetical protein